MTEFWPVEYEPGSNPQDYPWNHSRSLPFLVLEDPQENSEAQSNDSDWIDRKSWFWIISWGSLLLTQPQIALDMSKNKKNK